MRWISALSSWRLWACLIAVCALVLMVPGLGGVESGLTGSGRKSSHLAPAPVSKPTPLQEPIRIAQRREQNKLDPSIEETPALPSESLPSTPDSGVENEVREAAIATAPASDVPIASTQASQPSATDDIAAPPAAWPRPTSLLDQLQKLAEDDPVCAQWAQRVRKELDQLDALPTLSDRSAGEILSRLSDLAEESREIARRLPREDLRSRMLRSGFGIVRRLAVWEPAYRAAVKPVVVAPMSAAAAAESRRRLALHLAAIEAELPRTGAVAAWRDYLLLDHLQGELRQPGRADDSLRLLSRELLYRLHSTQLSEVQTEFVQGPAFASLAQELKLWATEEMDLVAVLGAVEDYEQQEKAAAAVRLADIFERLRWSPDPLIAELAAAINTYYRNANVRVAFSAELVNRLLPGEQVLSEPVVDTIQNSYVEGQSQTNTKLRVVLLPTRGQWEFGIEANGDVASNTTSSSGPARFYQFGWSNFRARKRLTVDRRGIRIFQAEAEANSDTQLNDFETEFDGIPLLGGLARAIARNQYEQKSPAARHEVAGKISYRASAELDKQVASRLEKAKQDLQKQLVQPLQKLDLEPTAVDMETTQERLIARYRLAGRDQVSAYTPRPQAPGDSLLSVQIHESALNNVLEHLALQGRRVDLVTLYKEMSGRFSGKQVPVPQDIPDDVFVTFAEEDPVRVDCEDGHVRLTIRLRSIEQGDRAVWEDLTVVARYKPDAEQLDANLVREGIIELPEKHLQTKDRLALSAIFGKVLSRNRKLNLINERISKSPQLKDQQVTQFVIHDGWIGVALGPKTQERQAQAAQQQRQ